MIKKRRSLIDKRELVAPEDIGAAQFTNGVLLEGYVQERAHSLRADVLALLLKHNALNNDGEGWAIFTAKAGEDRGSTATISPDKEVLLLTKRCYSPINFLPFLAPGIRIITNEPCVDVDNEEQWLGIDFTLDHENYAQYNIGANTDETEESEDSNSLTPLFFIDEGGELGLTSNFRSLTPIRHIIGDDQERIHPFGHYRNPWDVLYAIEIGHGILREVINIEPAHRYSSIDN